MALAAEPSATRTRRLLTTLVALAALAATLGVAGPAAPPAAAATTPLEFVGTMNHTNSGIYPGAGPREAFSSPAVADITGDRVPEIVVGNMDGTVTAYRATDRTLLWSRNLGNTAIQSTPTLADLGSDGKRDVVVGTMDGRVVWLNGPDGRVVRTFRQGAPLHCPAGQDCRPDGFFASPAVGDINGDRIMDIIAPSYDHTVYAWSKTGTLLWRTFLEDTLWSSPVIADIDRDQRPEIVLGGDIWAGNKYGVPAGGLVWVLKRDGSTYPGYPRSTPGQTVWSSPAVADLNGDKLADIVVGTGANWPEPAGRRVDAFTAKTRANLPGWPVSVDGRVVASPAVGDIDGDGVLEVTFASDGGWVYAYERNGSRKWRVCNALTTSSCKQGYSTKSGTVIADVDADGIQEVISTLDKHVRVYDGRNGATEAEYRMAHPATLAPGSSPAVAEVQGETVIVQSSLYRKDGHGGQAIAGDLTKLYLFRTGHGLCRADWPQFHRDAGNTGLYFGTYGRWVPFTCPEDFVRQQYRDFLGREPDASGIAYWTGRLHDATLGSDVIRSFLGSSEFGAAVAPVMRAYLATHGTYPPTADLITAAVAEFRNGTPIAEIAEQFAQDQATQALSDEQFVTLVYRSVYKRDPSYLELPAEVDRLENGTTRGALASGHAETSIGQQRLSTEVTVAMIYLGMLGRAPDPQGWDYWVPKARVSNTHVLVNGFQVSSEYERRVT